MSRGAVALALLFVVACTPVGAQPAAAPVPEWGGLTVLERGSSTADAAFVLLHGYGAPGDDLAPLAEELAARAPRPVRVLVPAAPIAMSHGGRAWWAIRARDEEVQIARAREAVLGVVATLADRGVPPERVVVGGFSQGGILSIELAYAPRAPRLAGIAVLSGRALEHAPREDARLRGLAIFQSHGRTDERIPFGRGEAFRARAERAGAHLEHVAFEGGHAIPPEVTEGLASWLARTLR